MSDQIFHKFVGKVCAPDPGNPLLIDKIRGKIQAEGKITFSEFMEMALYDPEFGYYTSGRETVGTSGDFLTSPSMHPLFGAAIARWLCARWKDLGSPEGFEVVEMGAGKGFLCASVLSHISEKMGDFYKALNYRIVEASTFRPAFEGLEKEVNVAGSLEEIPDNSVNGCFISNELVDAFPVHLVTIEDGQLREIYVSVEDDRFVEVVGEPSTPEIVEYFRHADVVLPEGYRTEVNLKALQWMGRVARKLREGFVLTIDYGYTSEAYYSPERARGTLLCYYRHSCFEDPYMRVGRQDITAHAEWSGLIDAGKNAGLEMEAFTSQREFLIGLGIESLVESPGSRRAAMALLDKHGMGGFHVLVQKKR